YLEEIGELENTIIIVTSDNGMAFPRAKANAYEYGIHVPFAVRYPKEFPEGKIVNNPIGFADLAPTILELTNSTSDGMLPISGESFAGILKSENEDSEPEIDAYAFAGRERHSSSRYLNWGYPQRTVRSEDFLMVWNMKPERWPAGAPQRIVKGTTDELWPMYGIDEDGKHHSEWAFTDIDAAPTKSFIIENRNDEDVSRYFDLAHAKRPEWEMFNVKNDPYCLNNLAGDETYADLEKQLRDVLLQELTETEDPRVVGADKEVFDSYKRYSPMREFPKPESPK
ncbi:MAG TPA: sulfatase-like hydrolase/transferase, partial [Prolixibacteraceae bacterium]|nr:sulfatase-like hydrolase/transferase [Prolixibacteraceae bacterium]